MSNFRYSFFFNTIFLVIALFCNFIFFNNSWALEVPALTGPVVDVAGVLPLEQNDELSKALIHWNDDGWAQIQVLIIPTLSGDVLEEYSIKVTDAWKLGTAKKDNGLLILLVTDDRKVRLEIGQGLEGDVTDAQSYRIIQRMIPALKEKDYGSAIAIALNALNEIHKLGDLKEDKNSQRHYSRYDSLLSGFYFIIFFIFIFIFFIRSGGYRNRTYYRGGNWGGGSGGGFGGGFGGGWGGGGGGFSGGGSSGSW